MRHWIGLLCLTCLLTLTQAQIISDWQCPPGFSGQTLHVYNWTTYIAPNTIADFEAACNVIVIYDEYEDDDDMLLEIRRGNYTYDVIVPTNDLAAVMIAENLLRRLNHDNIPNRAQLITSFRNLGFDPENQFTIPYQWGTYGIGYHRERVSAPIVSWGDVFAYEGPVGWLNRPDTMMSIALKYLGYDTNTTDLSALLEARDFLIAAGKRNVRLIEDSEGQDLLRDGELDIVVEFSGDILQLNEACDCNDFAYILPEEGTVVWIDLLAIPQDAPNPDLAEVFIDFILDPVVSAQISNATFYASPNLGAHETGLISEAIITNSAIYPPINVLNNLYFLTKPVAEIQSIYENIWTEIQLLIQP